MVQGRGRVDGATRWLACAVRTLQKEVRELKDLLEECHSYKKQLKQLRADPVLARVYGSVDGSDEGYDDDSGGCVPPSTLTPSCPRQLGSSFPVDDDLDSRAPPLLLTSFCSRQFGSSSDVDDDLQDVENVPPSAHTPSCLTQLGSSFAADDDLQNVDNISHLCNVHSCSSLREKLRFRKTVLTKVSKFLRVCGLLPIAM